MLDGLPSTSELRSKTAVSPQPRHGHRPSVLAMLLVGVSWSVRAAALLSLVLCRPLIQRNIRMSSKVLGALGAVAFMGSTGGAILSGLVADAFGRKRALVVSMGVSMLGLYGASRARGHVHLIIGHVLVGIGAGGELSSASALLYELAARTSDGMRLVALLGVFAAIGGLAGVALSMMVAPLVGWRELYHVGSIAGAVHLAVMMRWLPESPRWQKLRHRGSLQHKLKIDTELPVMDPERSQLLRERSEEPMLKRHQISPRQCIKTLLLSSALLAALSTSSYVFTIYVPTLLSLHAFSVFGAWQPLVAIRIAEALGTALGVVMMAWRGFNRTLLECVSLMVASAVLLVVTVSSATSTTAADQSWKSAAPFMTTAGTAVVSMLASASWSCALAKISSGFSVQWRGRGVGVVFAVTSAADSIGVYLYPHLFNDARLSPLVITMLFGAIVMSVTLAFVADLDQAFVPSYHECQASKEISLPKTPSAESTHSETSDEDEDADWQRSSTFVTRAKRRARSIGNGTEPDTLINDTLKSTR